MASVYDNEAEATQMLAAALHELPENRLFCRGLRHAWDVDEDFHVYKTHGSDLLHLRRTFKCMRECGVRVTEIFINTKRGIERTSRYMDYSGAEGYQIPGVPRGVKPLSIIQQEQYRRAMEKVAKVARGDREHGER